MLKKICYDCGAATEDLRRVAGGKKVCNECWIDHVFTCAKCHKEVPVAEHGAIGNVLVVADLQNLKDGTYTVQQHPYLMNAMFNGWLYTDSVKWIAPVPTEVDFGDYLVIHYCTACSIEAKLEAHIKPNRIQRSRARGWRMPVGAIYVGRPSPWGNPYRVGDKVNGILLKTPGMVVQAFERQLDPDLVRRAQAELRGHDLACWCAPTEACHADVWLRLANQ